MITGPPPKFHGTRDILHTYRSRLSPRSTTDAPRRVVPMGQARCGAAGSRTPSPAWAPDQPVKRGLAARAGSTRTP